MSYDFENNRTTTLERPTETKIDLIDKRVEENTSTPSFNQIEKEINQFDNSHQPNNLNNVYNQIDRQTIQKTQSNGLVNPFFGDSNSLEKMRKKQAFKDVVETPQNPTIEIDTLSSQEVEKEKPKKAKKSLTSRMKLWITTGACCAVLMLGLIVCNALSIGSIDRSINSSENSLIRQEQELKDLNANISSQSGVTPEGMTSINGASIDITPTNDPSITPSDNFFNRLTDFISYLFGR